MLTNINNTASKTDKMKAECTRKSKKPCPAAHRRAAEKIDARLQALASARPGRLRELERRAGFERLRLALFGEAVRRPVDRKPAGIKPHQTGSN
jgi:hypothetical protein